jgi:hypothetical protein
MRRARRDVFVYFDDDQNAPREALSLATRPSEHADRATSR